MEKGFFHPDRGYWQTLTDPSPEYRNQYPEGTIEVPLQPSPLHKFDGEGWTAPTQAEVDAAAAEAVRAKRDVVLRNDLDPIVSNPLRWAAMTEQQRQDWAGFRDALLAIPEQDGFPHNVVWPAQPSI